MRHESDLPRLEGPAGSGGGRGSGPALAEVQQYVDALRRRWWVIAATALIAVAVAWWGERDRIPTYTAEALLEHRRESPLIGSDGGGQAPDFGARLELIRSRTVLSTVVDSLGLRLVVREREPERTRIFERVEVGRDAPPGSYTLERQQDRLILREAQGSEPIATASLDEWIEGRGFRLRVRDPSTLDEVPVEFRIQDWQATVERLQGRIRVEPARSPTLMRVGYNHTDPEMAAAVVNTVAEAYRLERASAAREAASRRRQVIADQLVGLADSLSRAQEAVVEYQRGARLLDPGYEGGQVMAAVLQTENELRTLRFQEGLLSSVVAGLESEDGADDSLNRILSLGSELVPAGPSLHRRLEDLEMERARLMASTFGRLEQDPEVQTLDSLIASTKAQMRTAVRQGLDHIRTRIDGAEARLGQMRAEMAAVPGQTAELSRLRQRADAVQDVVDVLVDRYYEAQIAEGIEQGDVAVVDAAPVPLWPDPAQTRVVLLVGLMGGLMVGLLGVMVLEFFDLRVRRSVDAEEATGLPLIGMVPRLSLPSRDPVAAAIGKESFRSLRMNLHFAHQSMPRVIAVSSATPKEGKTTVCVNLAASLAEQQGPDSVLLVDADLRRPQLHRIFGMDRAPGLTDLLTGRAQMDEAIRPSPSHSKLHLLTCGSPVHDPSEVIGGRAFPELVEALRQQYSFVVIDTPPVLAVTDGAVTAKVVDGTLIVVRADQTDRVAVANAMDQLRQIDVTLLGVILNAVGNRTMDGRYAYPYYDEYLAEDDLDSRDQGRRRALLGAPGPAS